MVCQYQRRLSETVTASDLDQRPQQKLWGSLDHDVRVGAQHPEFLGWLYNERANPLPPLYQKEQANEGAHRIGTSALANKATQTPGDGRAMGCGRVDPDIPTPGRTSGEVENLNGVEPEKPVFTTATTCLAQG